MAVMQRDGLLDTLPHMLGQRAVDIADGQVIVISDGRAGHENQSIGVAEVLGFADPEVMTLRRRGTALWQQKLYGFLPVKMAFANLDVLAREICRTADKGPLVLIGAGTQVSRVLRSLKRMHPPLFTVCLMRPAGNVADFDVVAVPQHDRGVPNAENVVRTLGPANRVNHARLASEQDRWQKRLAALPKPRLAVLIGGPLRRREVSDLTKMVKAIFDVANKRGMSVLMSTSRRTPQQEIAAIRDLVANSPVRAMVWSPGDPTQRDNPYMAFLATSEAVVVSADSVSMVCEAATAGKPVYVWGKPDAMPEKFRRLYEALMKQGRAKWWDGVMNLRPPAAGLMDTVMIAGFIRARWTKVRVGG